VARTRSKSLRRCTHCCLHTGSSGTSPKLTNTHDGLLTLQTNKKLQTSQVTSPKQRHSRYTQMAARLGEGPIEWKHCHQLPELMKRKHRFGLGSCSLLDHAWSEFCEMSRIQKGLSKKGCSLLVIGPLDQWRTITQGGKTSRGEPAWERSQ